MGKHADLFLVEILVGEHRLIEHVANVVELSVIIFPRRSSSSIVPRPYSTMHGPPVNRTTTRNQT